MPQNNRFGIDYTGKKALITGKLSDVTVETGIALSQYGATVIMPCDADDTSKILTLFRNAGATMPVLIDSIQAPTYEALISLIQDTVNGVDIVICADANTTVTPSFDTYTLPLFKQSLSEEAWPLVGLLQAIRSTFRTLPRYVIALSSGHADRLSSGNDFGAVAQSVKECFVRYLSHRFLEHNVMINTLKTGLPNDVANAVVALCSGYCDAVRGQLIPVDRGAHFL